MTPVQMLALIVMMVNSAAIVLVLKRFHYRYYLRPKIPKRGSLWTPLLYPEEGEDAAFCDICHGRLGSERMAACACGKRFHTGCASDHGCPNCGNDYRHMFHPMPLVMRCPVCIRRAPGGYCGHCGVTYPQKEGTFRCAKCGSKVLCSNPRCEKCGRRYRPRLAKGYMSRVRSRR